MSSELNLNAALSTMLARAGVALHEAVVIGPFAVSQERVPLEHGDLQASGHVSEPVSDGDTVSVTISYGDQGQLGIIAIVQHERTDFVHPDPKRTAKYLELPALEFASEMTGAVAVRMR